MPVPIVAYLRVYEPLRVFAGPEGAAVREALDRGPLPVAAVGALERELGMRAVLRSRILPERRTEVLTTEVDGEVLVCPLDIRPRSGAALLSFLDATTPGLAAAALPVPLRTARRLAEEALAELGGTAAHVVSANWTVPLPWFTVVEQEQRQHLADPCRVWWQVPMTLARERAGIAETVLRETIGEAVGGDGPVEMLAEMSDWLDRFDDESVVELDYGGVTTVLDAKELADDRSAADVAAALDALAEDDQETAGEAYERLRDYWSVVAAREHAC